MNATTAAAVSAAPALAQMLLGNQIQQAIHVAARLEIADRLQDGPCTAAELARAASAHPPALLRLLRALASVGIFAEDDEGRFSLTPLAEPLAGGPRSVRPFALWSGGVSYRAFGALEHSVRTGEPAFEHLFGSDFFEYLAAHPEAGGVFDEMMSRHTAPVARAIASLDLPGVETVADVGGGRGELLAAILAARPGLRGILVERPRVLDQARRVLADAGVGDRCDVVAADMRERLPPADAYVLKSVLHGLGDADAVRVLAACRDAMHDGGVVLVVDLVLPAGGAPSPGRLMDLLMLVGCHGRERTAAEHAQLFEAARLRLAGLTPVARGYAVVEARGA